jgi:cell division inhibitor SepF
MEDLIERPTFFTRLTSRFQRNEEAEYYDETPEYDSVPTPQRMRAVSGYRIAVRRQVETYDDAVEAADGLRRGEQQILNLSFCPPALREKIKDFMSGVNYAMDGEWVELGENVFLLAPRSAEVDVVPASDGMRARRN